jgi:uncharacterized protein YqgC (DUF456 family)
MVIDGASLRAHRVARGANLQNKNQMGVVSIAPLCAVSGIVEGCFVQVFGCFLSPLVLVFHLRKTLPGSVLCVLACATASLVFHPTTIAADLSSMRV